MAPQGRMRGELAAAARVWVISASPPLISQRSGPLTASPAGEANAIAKKLIWRGCESPSLPPRGKVAPQGRMRGSLTATTHSRAATASAALISQRSGPLTASPAGEADAIAKKMIWRGCEPPSLPPRGKAAPQGRMRGELAAAARVWVISASPPLISQRAGPLTASPKGEAARRKKSAKTILTCTCFCGRLIVVKKAATGSRPSAHLEGLQKPRVIP